MFVVTKKAVGALPVAKPLFPSAVSEKARTAIMQIHRGLRRFFRRPLANHAKTNSYPLNTRLRASLATARQARNDAKEEEIDGTTPAYAEATARQAKVVPPISCHWRFFAGSILCSFAIPESFRGYTFGCGGAALGKRSFHDFLSSDRNL